MPTPISPGAPVQIDIDSPQVPNEGVAVQLNNKHVRFAESPLVPRAAGKTDAKLIKAGVPGLEKPKDDMRMLERKSLLKRIEDFTGVNRKAFLSNFLVGAATGAVVGGFAATMATGGIFSIPGMILGAAVGGVLFAAITVFALNNRDDIAARAERAQNDKPFGAALGLGVNTADQRRLFQAQNNVNLELSPNVS